MQTNQHVSFAETELHRSMTSTPVLPGSLTPTHKSTTTAVSQYFSCESFQTCESGTTTATVLDLPCSRSTSRSNLGYLLQASLHSLPFSDPDNDFKELSTLYSSTESLAVYDHRGKKTNSLK